jgi:hypothetical protein
MGFILPILTDIDVFEKGMIRETVIVPDNNNQTSRYA